VVTTGAIRRAKLQSKCHHQQTNIQFFTGWMSFQQCHSTERGKFPVFISITEIQQCRLSRSHYLCGTAAGDVNAHVESVTFLTLSYCCKVRNKTHDFHKTVSECRYSFDVKWTQLRRFAESFLKILDAKSYLTELFKNK